MKAGKRPASYAPSGEESSRKGDSGPDFAILEIAPSSTAMCLETKPDQDLHCVYRVLSFLEPKDQSYLKALQGKDPGILRYCHRVGPIVNPGHPRFKGDILGWLNELRDVLKLERYGLELLHLGVKILDKHGHRVFCNRLWSLYAEPLEDKAHFEKLLACMRNPWAAKIEFGLHLSVALDSKEGIDFTDGKMKVDDNGFVVALENCSKECAKRIWKMEEIKSGRCFATYPTPRLLRSRPFSRVSTLHLQQPICSLL